jgi:hypothetical protein
VTLKGLLEYPQEPLDKALRVALDHGLLELHRIETLVLRFVAGDFFRLPRTDDDPKDPQ